MQEQSFKSLDVNKVLFWILVLYLVWQLNAGWKKSTAQVVSQNAGSDPSTQQAIQLRQAMNPSGSSWFMGFDTTDTTLLFATAKAITSYSDVAKAYLALYQSDLTNDLQSDLKADELVQFWALVNGTKPSRATTGGTTTTGGTSTGTTTKPATATSVGKTVTATTTANIRVDATGYAVEKNALGQNKQSKKGDVLGRYVTEKVLPDVPNKGNRNVFVKYEELVYIPLTSMILYTVPHWIVKSAVTIK